MAKNCKCVDYGGRAFSENVDAAKALMQWFISQRISESDASDIMIMILAGIIRSTAGKSAKKRTEGVEHLLDDMIELMAPKYD